ncbi:MAG: alpha/beta fold hydrolase [Gemmatimonadota bacterium]|nr:MAG: alpha/beta fold hydrolase [Gemmatimonadota bacterium]
MLIRRLITLGAGAVAGAYLVGRWRRNQAKPPRPLRDHRGRTLEPLLVELEGGDCVPVIVAGEGPAVVLIPGLTGDSGIFRYQIPALSSDYRVIAPNLRVDFTGVEKSFDQFARDLARVLDAVGADSACLLGLSFGGPIAMRFATLYPKRAWGLVLTNTLARVDLSHVGLNRTLLIPVARWTSRFLPEPLMRELAQYWGRLGVWVYDPSAGNERIIDYELEVPVRVPMSVGGARMDTFKDCDLRGELRGLQQPALVIAGCSDTYTPWEWQHEIAGLLANSTYVEIPYGGHLLLISHAESFNELVMEWLARVRRATPVALPDNSS